MSEATVTETPEAPAVEMTDGMPSVLDAVGRSLYDGLGTQSAKVIALTSEINVATGKTSDMFDSMKSSFGSDSDSTAEDKKLADEIEKLLSEALKREQLRDTRINERIAALTANATEDVAPKIEERDKLRKAVNNGRNYLTGTYGDDAVYGLPKISATKSASAGGTGKSGPRVRSLNVYVDGEIATSKDKDGNLKSSLSAGAKAASVSTADLQAAFWTAQGTQIADDFKDEVTFEVTGTDNKSHHIKCVKQSADNDE